MRFLSSFLIIGLLNALSMASIIPRDGGELTPRDGTELIPRDGTELIVRDGTDLMPRAGPQLIGGAVDMTSGKNGTYPRANLLKDGTLIGAYTSFPNITTSNISSCANITDLGPVTSCNITLQAISIAKSTDSGSSWQALGNVTSGSLKENDIDNPYVIELPNGQLLTAIRNHSKDPVTGNYTKFRISVFSSDDVGVTWKFLSEPDSKSDGTQFGLWEPFLRLALDGSLQIYYSLENSKTDQDQVLRTSTDNGKTWSERTTVIGSETTGRDGMIGIANVTGTNLIAIFETGINGNFTVNSVTSSDDGKTWAKRTQLYKPENNNNAGAPQIANVGGTLVASFMTDEDTQLHNWFDGVSAKILVSTDQGSTWGEKTTIYGVQAVWPALLTLDKSNFLVMADHFGAHAQKVSLA